MYPTKEEVLNHFGINEFPSISNINPKTNKPYHKNTWHWWLWWYGLDESSKNALSDMEA